MSQTNRAQPQQYRWRFLARLSVLAVILGVLLLADLQFRGLAWQFFWSQTGEEEPFGQILGMVQAAGNLIRPQPQTAPYASVHHTAGSPFGINTFLQDESEAAKRVEQMRLISAAGFRWIRQEFTWEDLEVDGRGQFTDSRNDYDGDGVPDTINSFDKYDHIVGLAEEFGIQIQARLSNPPAWAHSNPEIGTFAPPDDLQDFINYALTVAERYQGRITHYQIWNEPNIFPEWGHQRPDPAAYTEMLCRTHDALKTLDPNIVIISGAIAPTQALTGFDYQDLVYLQNMYDLGAADCFDILSAQGYGLFSGPTDRRLRFNQFGFQRHIYYRDIMVRNGDAHKPIWISEAAWNPVLDAYHPPEDIAGYSQYGTATLEQAARYMPMAYQRAQEEWPWIGQISYWFFTRASNLETDQAFYYFRMVEPDYSPEKPTMTPQPIYHSMRDYIAAASTRPLLYRGVHQAQSWEITTADAARIIADESAQFGQAVETSRLHFEAQGTGLSLRLRNPDAAVSIVQDGTFILKTLAPSDDWQQLILKQDLVATDHFFTIESDAVYVIDSITVIDRTWQNILPILLPIGAIVLLALIEIGRALKHRFTH